MNIVENRIIRKETVVLDGNKFINCQFIDCHMEFRGGNYGLVKTSFENCDWRFFDAARHTIDLLLELHMDITTLQDNPSNKNKLN